MSSQQQPPRVRISIDRGGTFTDVHASIPERSDIILKLLSVDPSNYKDAPTEGIRRVLEIATGKKIPRGQQLDLAPIESLRMGTTVATNALLERKGARSALLISKGFKDLLVIGNQSRPNIFDLSVAKPGVLYERVIEVDERVTLKGYAEDPDPQPIEEAEDVVRGITGEYIHILVKPDMEKVRSDLQLLWDEGYRSIAVVLLHSYTFPEHEKLIGQAASEMGFSVAISSELQPMIKAVPRGMSATADAYLTPIIREYVDSISSNFIGGLAFGSTRCEFMQSDGGLVDFRKFSGLKAILSGPAGGVVGYAETSWDDDEQIPVIGFDMGGTSTDGMCWLYCFCNSQLSNFFLRRLHYSIPLLGSLRPRLRNHNCRNFHSIPPTRHQHRRGRGRLDPFLEERSFCRGTRVGLRTSRASLLPKRGTPDRN